MIEGDSFYEQISQDVKDLFRKANRVPANPKRKPAVFYSNFEKSLDDGDVDLAIGPTGRIITVINYSNTESFDWLACIDDFFD